MGDYVLLSFPPLSPLLFYCTQYVHTLSFYIQGSYMCDDCPSIRFYHTCQSYPSHAAREGRRSRHPWRVTEERRVDLYWYVEATAYRIEKCQERLSKSESESVATHKKRERGDKSGNSVHHTYREEGPMFEQPPTNPSFDIHIRFILQYMCAWDMS